MDDPRKRKPVVVPTKPHATSEAFIGHDAITMMVDESFEDFERRLAEAQDWDGAGLGRLLVPDRKSVRGVPEPQHVEQDANAALVDEFDLPEEYAGDGPNEDDQPWERARRIE
jgi:hypothetical protein